MATSTVQPQDILRGLECPICQEYFREPRMLPCGHTLCLKPCLVGIAGTKTRVLCAECRAEHTVPVGGVQNFPKNVAILRQVVPEQKRPEGRRGSELTRCPICGEDDDLRKCGHCEMFLCYTCVTQHLPKLKQNVLSVASEIEDHADNASKMSASAEEATRLLMKENVDACLAEIDMVTNRAFKLILTQTVELKAQVKTAHQQNLVKVSAMSRDASKRLETLKQQCGKAIRDVRDENSTFSPTKLVKIIENLKSECAQALQSKEDFNMVTNIAIEIDFRSLEDATNSFAFVKIPDQRRTQSMADGGPTAQVQMLSIPLKPSKSHKAVLRDSILGNAVTIIKMKFGSEGSRPGQFSDPWAIAVDEEDGDIVVADTGNDRIQRFNPFGKLCFYFGSKGSGPLQFSSPFALAINRRSQMIISDKGNNRIKVHNKDGFLCHIIGASDAEPELLNCPMGLALDINENIHVCDNDREIDSIRILRQDGTCFDHFDTPDCPYPVLISTSSTGVTCVSDEDTCVVFNDQQQQTSTWEFDGTVCGICVDGAGHVLASDVENQKLLLYSLNGVLLRVVFDFSSDAQIYQPRGVTIDKHGYGYVACKGAVLKF